MQRDAAGWAAVLLAGLIAAPAVAQGPTTSGQARKMLDAAQHDRAAALAAQQAASDRAAAAVAEAARLAANREQAEARLRDARKATEAAAEKVRALATARQAAAAQVAARARALEPLLPVLQRLSRYPAETMLAVDLPPEEAIRGVTVLAGIGQEIARQAEALRHEQASLRAASAALTAAAPALNAAEAAQEAAAADLARRIVLAEAARRAAEQEAAAAGERAESLSAQAAELAALLDKLQAAEDRAAARRKVAMKPPAVPAPGRLLVPVSGRVVRSFGDHTDTGTALGVSYRAAPGAAVVAPCGGRVLFAAPFRSYGQLLIIDCADDLKAILAGFERLDVKVGEVLRRGAAVGILPAGVDHPALYVELREQGEPVDPSKWLGRGRKRP